MQVYFPNRTAGFAPKGTAGSWNFVDQRLFGAPRSRSSGLSNSSCQIAWAPIRGFARSLLEAGCDAGQIEHALVVMLHAIERAISRRQQFLNRAAIPRKHRSANADA